MNIALCISGQPRFFKSTYPYLKRNFIDVNENVDVFFHTWKYPDNFKGLPFSGASWNHGNTDNYLGHDETFKQLNETYKPKSFMFTEPIFLNENWNEWPLTNGENLASVTHTMFYSIKKSVIVAKEYSKKNNIEYDVVVRTRFDATPMTQIKINEVEKDILYHTDSCNNKSVMSDWFFWSRSENMYKLCSVYDKIRDMVFNRKVMCCGEEILTAYLVDLGLLRKATIDKLCLTRRNDFNEV